MTYSPFPKILTRHKAFFWSKQNYQTSDLAFCVVVWSLDSYFREKRGFASDRKCHTAVGWGREKIPPIFLPTGCHPGKARQIAFPVLQFCTIVLRQKVCTTVTAFILVEPLLVYFSVNVRVITFWCSLFNVPVHWAASAYALSGLMSNKHMSRFV